MARYYTPSGRSIQKEYQRGDIKKYDLDLIDRYTHGEFYSADSIKLDKDKIFHTVNGREVYGGGGIMPDVFIPEDTTGYTSYYMTVANQGLIQKYAYTVADSYRKYMDGSKSLQKFKQILPPDDMLLVNFVEFAVDNGVPARWYYITKSQDLLLSQIKAVIARDVLGYSQFVELLNEDDNAVKEAVKKISAGESPVNIQKKEK